eukprot:7756149-Alexandrium_andersonii.AAC.1
MLGVVAVVGGEAAAVGPSVDHDPTASVTAQRYQKLAFCGGREAPGGVCRLRHGEGRQRRGRVVLQALCRRSQRA